jgi:valyl-tRNA synthetase
VEQGDTVFLSKEWEKVYFQWMRNIQDWCISRQLWWGHQIPAWFCDDCDHVTVMLERASACAGCGSTSIRQDEDVLDTWFSSGLWPFATLGWPEQTKALKTFYPGTVMETGFDIIFFWVARMMMMGLRCMGEVPFKTVYLHAMVRDEKGQKMSKTRGNVIDPLEVTKVHGADALRFTLATMAAQGRDIKLSLDRVSGYRAFANKIWNATRFVLMNIPEGDVPKALDLDDRKGLSLADRWILDKLEQARTDVTEAMDEYRLNDAAMSVYGFFWHVYCDWYIELAKPTLRGEGEGAEQTRRVLMHVLDQALRLLHPFMPFVTEEIWMRLPLAKRDAESIMVSAWPAADERRRDEEATGLLDQVIELIGALRTIRGENQIAPKKKM